MAGEIKINRVEFDAALKSIQGLQSRSIESTSKFRADTLTNTDAPSVTNYMTAISTIKDYIGRYNTLLQGDIGNLYKIADSYAELDDLLANHPPELSSPPGSNIHR